MIDAERTSRSTACPGSCQVLRQAGEGSCSELQSTMQCKNQRLGRQIGLRLPPSVSFDCSTRHHSLYLVSCCSITAARCWGSRLVLHLAV